MIIKETFGGAALLASFAGVDATWLSNAMIFIAAAAATIFYIKGAVKKSPPDTEKYRHVTRRNTAMSRSATSSARRTLTRTRSSTAK